ncbi:MAG TPA: YceI family protein [Leptospiraceae bacterium]|nr:YceI family protein [Leptospiraceae bacterium]HNF26321.1 YceI family protein [Leptospiraceae bacterium]HNM05670.1 YceI family protein [Leptospiraceae bacterium]HNN05245.1 YceI family protein [Leptospiraceae bacterium]
MNLRKSFITISGLIIYLTYGMLSAVPVKEDRLKVESGKMLFTLKKKNSSGYDPDMVKSETMTGMANRASGTVNMKDRTFDITMDVGLETFFLGGKFKFANTRMHENYLESSKYSSVNYKGTIVSYDEESGKAKVKGKMTLHGVSKDNFSTEGTVTVSKSGKGYLLTVSFNVNLRDFGIQVPNTKITKIREMVALKVKLELVPDK